MNIKSENKKDLAVIIGKDEYGKDLVIDLSTAKHLLVAGATGSGKSVLLHKMICTLLERNSPADLKLLLIDPKRVDLTVYNGIPHLLTPVIIEPKKAVVAIRWAVHEMGRRYGIFEQEKCKSISDYQGKENMPTILIVIDEFSDLMQTYPKETEPVVLKIAQMGHVVGIHIILSTSRCSTKIFTQSIRGAISARIALQASTTPDSKLIIGVDDACKLRGAGDMLFREGLKYIIRGQVTEITYDEEKAFVKNLCNTYKDYSYDQTKIDDSSSEYEDEDELYYLAREAVVKAGKASTSYVQRSLGVGYSRAAKLMDLLEQGGVIGPARGSEPREVIGN